MMEAQRAEGGCVLERNGQCTREPCFTGDGRDGEDSLARVTYAMLLLEKGKQDSGNQELHRMGELDEFRERHAHARSRG